MNELSLPPLERECTGCHKTKPLDDFYNQPSGRYGKTARCKVCLKQYATAWHKAHPERGRKATAAWRIRNPEKVQEYNQQPRERTYSPEKNKIWRTQRLQDPEYRARLNQQANDRARILREWLRAYKLEHGCIDCGYRENHLALDFDHVRGTKAHNVCHSKSISQAQKEIEKCVVRCANCHRIKTGTQSYW